MQELTQARHQLNEVQQQLQDSSSKASQSEQQHEAVVMRLTQDLEQEQTARLAIPVLILLSCTLCCGMSHPCRSQSLLFEDIPHWEVERMEL